MQTIAQTPITVSLTLEEVHFLRTALDAQASDPEMHQRLAWKLFAAEAAAERHDAESADGGAGAPVREMPTAAMTHGCETVECALPPEHDPHMREVRGPSSPARAGVHRARDGAGTP